MIQVNNLQKSFQGKKALDGVNMSVGKGDIYGLVGPNGAGKSTLIRHLVGVYRQDAGEVFIDGQPVFENVETKAKIAYIPDDFFYFGQADTMEMMRYYKGIYPTFDEKCFYHMQEFFPSIDVKSDIRRLSKGMQKQVAFWLSICCKPELLILDEPTSGLDPFSRDELLDIFMALRDDGVAVFFSTHIISDLEKCADDIVYISDGRIKSAMAVKDFFSAYSHRDENLEQTILRLEKEKTV